MRPKLFRTISWGAIALTLAAPAVITAVPAAAVEPDPRWRSWYFTNDNTDIYGAYGDTYFGLDQGDKPVAGDWNSDGLDTAGVFRLNAEGYGDWYLTDQHSGVPAAVNHQLRYGLAGDIPVPGDWNGDSRTTPGVYRVQGGYGYWYLNNSMVSDDTAVVVQFGLAGDIPVSGDWDGNGTWTPGVVRNNEWFISNDFSGATHQIFGYGDTGDVYVAGDWDGNRTFTPGVMRGTDFWLNNDYDPYHDVRQRFGFGTAGGDSAVVGDWNGDGIMTPGVSRADVSQPPPPLPAATISTQVDGRIDLISRIPYSAMGSQQSIDDWLSTQGVDVNYRGTGSCIAAITVAIVTNIFVLGKLAKVKAAFKELGGTAAAMRSLRAAYTKFRERGYSRSGAIKAGVSEVFSGRAVLAEARDFVLEAFAVQGVIDNCL